MAKPQYQHPKKGRIKGYGFMWWEPVNSRYDFVSEWGDWFTPHEFYKKVTRGTISSARDCRSVKAFIRQVRKSRLPKGTKCVLVSRWMGYDVYFTKDV